MPNLIRSFGILIALFYFNNVQAQIDPTKLVELKDKRMKNKDPFWNYCSINGMPDFSNLADSINQYSIKVPKNYESTIISAGEFYINQLKSPKKNTDDYPILEIKVGKTVSEDLGTYFDKILTDKIAEKSLRTFGKEIINGNSSFWIESSLPKKVGNLQRQLSFYLVNPANQKIFTITIKSYKKEKSNRDFCVFGFFVRNLEWIN